VAYRFAMIGDRIGRLPERFAYRDVSGLVGCLVLPFSLVEYKHSARMEADWKSSSSLIVRL
jgi:hypothetical protein